MKKILFLIIAIFSSILYFVTPERFDRMFCIICLLLFLIQAYIIIRDDIKHINLLNFNLLFFFSLFTCTYVFPVFLIGNQSIIGTALSSSISSFDTINRSVALSTFATSIYSLSYVVFRKHLKARCVGSDEYYDARNILRNSRLITILASLGILLVTFNFLNTTHDVNIEVTDAPYLFQFFYFIIPIYFVCSAIYQKKKSGGSLTIKEYLKSNLTIIIVLVITSVFFLIIGDRAPIMSIGITLLASIALFVKRLRPITLIGLGLAGIMLMYALRVTRMGASSLSSGGFGAFVEASRSSMSANSSSWDMLSDLVGISFELNEGMNYVDKYGYLYPGANAAIFVFSPIPFVPSYLTQTFYGKLPVDVTPGPTISQYTKTAAGNHCVIDIFMPFGVIGIVVFFFLFGLLIAKISNSIGGEKLFPQMFYVYLMSISIFVARNSLTNLYRALILMYVMYAVLLYIKRRSITNRNKKLYILNEKY